MAIFLSYSRLDEKVVKGLAQGFDAARREVWLDVDLGGGDAWWDKILLNIRSCPVFVFALSDSSWVSKPCRAELAYAEALNRPIIPVQVAEVHNLRANPLAKLQIVNYRAADANAGFEVLAAVDAAARDTRPLPDPLPPEPPIPYAYLLKLGDQIDTAELDQADQTAVVDQLRKALIEEPDESVRNDVLAMLERLMRKPWTTRLTERTIRAVVLANEATNTGSHGVTPPVDGPGTTPPTVPPAKGPTTGREPAGGSAPPPSREPDGREIFERRMAELRRRKEEDDSRRAQQRTWDQPAAGGTWGGVSGGSGGSPSPGTWGGISTPAPQPPPSPPPAPPYRPQPTQPQPTQPQPTQPQPTQPQPQPYGPQNYQPQHFSSSGITSGRPASPPNYWALSIVAFLLSLLFGGIAMYFSYQVGQRYDAHDHDGAQKASRNAKAWGIVGIVVGVLGILVIGAGG